MRTHYPLLRRDNARPRYWVDDVCRSCRNRLACDALPANHFCRRQVGVVDWWCLTYGCPVVHVRTLEVGAVNGYRTVREEF